MNLGSVFPGRVAYGPGNGRGVTTPAVPPHVTHSLSPSHCVAGCWRDNSNSNSDSQSASAASRASADKRQSAPPPGRQHVRHNANRERGPDEGLPEEDESQVRVHLQVLPTPFHQELQPDDPRTYPQEP